MQPQSGFTPAEASVVAAFVGASAALLVVLVRDILIERHKERRKRKQELVDRKLAEIYSPLWVALGGTEGHLGNVLDDEELRARIGGNFHLLSPELQDILGRSLLIGSFKAGKLQMNHLDMQRVLELTPSFVQVLKTDLEKLQGEFSNA